MLFIKNKLLFWDRHNENSSRRDDKDRRSDRSSRRQKDDKAKTEEQEIEEANALRASLGLAPLER